MGGGGGDSAPAVSIYDPVEDQILNGTYRVLVSASDDSAVGSVELSIDGSAYFDITANVDSGYYYYDWDTNPNDKGDTHTLQAQATDDAMQSTESTVVNVSVDNINDHPVADADRIRHPGRGGIRQDGSVERTRPLDRSRLGAGQQPRVFAAALRHGAKQPVYGRQN